MQIRYEIEDGMESFHGKRGHDRDPFVRRRTYRKLSRRKRTSRRLFDEVEVVMTALRT